MGDLPRGGWTLRSRDLRRSEGIGGRQPSRCPSGLPAERELREKEPFGRLPHETSTIPYFQIDANRRRARPSRAGRGNYSPAQSIPSRRPAAISHRAAVSSASSRGASSALLYRRSARWRRRRQWSAAPTASTRLATYTVQSGDSLRFDHPEGLPRRVRLDRSSTGPTGARFQLGRQYSGGAGPGTCPPGPGACRERPGNWGRPGTSAARPTVIEQDAAQSVSPTTSAPARYGIDIPQARARSKRA